MARIDRWLAMNKPLLWRTHLHLAVWWSALLAIVVALFASFGPDRATPIWTESDLSLGVIIGAVSSLIASVLWAERQNRIALPELRLRKHLTLAGLNFSAICLWFFPTLLFGLIATHRTADAMADAVVKTDYDFHSRYHFWQGDRDLTEEVVSRHRAELDAALARLDLQTDGSVNEPASAAAYLSVWPMNRVSNATARVSYLLKHLPASDHYLVRDRIQSVRACKDLWQQQRGDYSGDCLVCVAVLCTWGVIGTGALAWASRPKYKRRQPAPKSASDKLNTMPAWFGRIDRWLLINHPITWATRIHRFAYRALLLGLALQLCALIGVDKLVPSSLLTVTKLLAIAAPQAQLLNRAPVVISNTAEWRSTVRAYLLVMWPIGIGAGALVFGLDITSFILLAVELFVLAHLLIVRLFFARWVVVVTTIVSFIVAIIMATEAMDHSSTFVFVAVSLVWLTVLLWFGLFRSVLGIIDEPRFINLWLVALTPFLLLLSSLLVPLALFESHSEKQDLLVAVGFATCLAVFAYPAYLRLLWPPSRALLNVRTQPLAT